MGARTRVFVGAAAAGVVGGWVFAQRRLVHHRRDLFSPRPRGRPPARGVRGGPTRIETGRRLRDYLAWETRPMLRRRALGIVRRMEASLG